MTESRSHKITANRLANKYKTEYNTAKGVDIQTDNLAVEVEPPDTIKDGIRQLRGYKKPVYISGTNQEAVEKALDATEGTTIGVMDNQGNILKRSTRKKR